MRESKTGRRGVCIRTANGTVNMEITGIEAAVRTFDALAHEIGSNRSDVVRQFVEACANAGEILLPQKPEKKVEEKTEPAEEKKQAPQEEVAKTEIVNKPRYLFPGAEPESEKKAAKRAAKEKSSAKASVAGSFSDEYKGTITV